jgi:hypothetical protein
MTTRKKTIFSLVVGVVDVQSKPRPCPKPPKKPTTKTMMKRTKPV